MRNLNFGILILAIAGIMFTSCKKESITMHKDDMSDEILSEIKNVNNPEDSVGYHHNELLKYYLKTHKTNSTLTTDLINMTEQYYVKIYGDDGNTVKEMMVEDPESRSEYISPISRSGLERMIKTSGVLSDYYLKVVNAIQDIDTTNLKTGYISAVNEIKEIEKEVQKIPDIPEIQKRKFFASSSVARYSIAFWFSNKTGAVHHAPAAMSIPWHKLVNIALSDIGGAIDHIDDPVTVYLGATSGGWLAGLYVAGWAAVHSAATYFSY